MKISEMTMDQATEAMIRLSGPFSSICDDEEMLKLMDEIQTVSSKNPNMHPLRQIAKFLPKIVTFALIKHKDDLYEIVGALTMQPTGVVGKLGFTKTVNVIKESYDDILAGFFTPSGVATSSNE